MSFLSEKFVRLAVPASRLAAVRTAAAAPRAFTTSAAVRKSPTETVKDGLKAVDRTVSDNVVIPGLDAAAKAKDVAQNMTKGDAKGKAQEMKGKAQEMKGQVKGAAHETAGKAKGAAEEAKRKL
ncbi:hypothetical protein HRG_003457 [Hirsutella rhossiliensis]|uniref:Lea domain protein n=1 Tax=Hirsutella rhossiliensis TaxID=111463 RepID=A0A9P8N3T0_9HYPO|nr:uncharacterized protein HRG_03457 [Hirsutella rhossiliensis]KAH0965441.1 hypothetical protein HRG_03457 [Hirsutella rhossiliensis]